MLCPGCEQEGELENELVAAEDQSPFEWELPG